jgi:hypothetical protein
VAPPPSEPQVSVEAVSNRVFLKVVGVAALVAVLAYFPWAFVIFASIWGLVWLVRRYPKAVAKIVATGVSLAFAVGAYVWAQDWTQEAKAKLQPRPPPGAPIDFALAPAQRLLAQYAPPTATGPNSLATAYCSCLADALRARFDGTAITATSVAEYGKEFSSRFQAATPDKATQASCLNQVNPRLRNEDSRKASEGQAGAITGFSR